MLDSLTKREFEVLNLMMEGYTNPEIAKKLYLSLGTVKSHVGTILRKFKARNRVCAILTGLKLMGKLK